MPLLNLQGKTIADNWRYHDADANLPSDVRNLIVPLASINDATKAVSINGATDLENLKKYFTQLDMIVIDFPSFSDGRGFSQAHWLKRNGYQGHLRAKGWLIPDQLRHLNQCSFIDIDLDGTAYQRHGAQSWQEPIIVNPSYQRSYGGDFATPAR